MPLSAKNKQYRVAGSVRGVISYHRLLSAAVRSLVRDRRQCAALGGGAYSDACVSERVGDRYQLVSCCEIEQYGVMS